MRDAMLRGVLVCSALLAVALLVSGCAVGTLSEAEQQSLAAAATGPAKLQPGDKIKVYVYGEDKLSGEYQLDQSGQISLPLAGTIKAKGLTQTELEQALAKKFRSEYLRNPKVTVTIATLAALLHDGRGGETWRICLQERSQRAHRTRYRRWPYISRKPLYSSDPAARRDQHARLSHIGIGSNLTRRCD